MPVAAAEATPLDRRRLERILAPWDGHAGLSIVIEDPSGAAIAGRPQPRRARTRDRRIEADVVVAGDLVARLVATGPQVDEAWVPRAIASLAIAIEGLVVEMRRRTVTQQALDEQRTIATADTLGIDAAELAKGRRQQRSILSLVAPEVPGYELASHYAAARDIGGDFFELFRLDRRGRPLAIVIADVTGKGLDAALLMAFARPVIHAALNASRGPAEALARTNRVLVGERRGTLFITAVCAILDPRTGRIRVANAGHESPLLIPGDGSPVRPVGASGALLGAFATITPPEVEATLEPGDILYCYTDGVTDAIDPSHARFGDDRLAATIEGARGRSAPDLVSTVQAAVEAFAAGTEPADDVTMVAVGRRPVRSRRQARD